MPNRMPTIDQVGDIMRLTAEGPPDAAFAAVDTLANEIFGHCLFTVTRFIPATEEVERAYSSNPGPYPVGGRKQKLGTPWADHVLNRGQLLICHGPADISRMFPDHEVILGLGIAGLVNMPVRRAGRSVGTMNIGHVEDCFAPADAPAMAMLAALLLPLVLA